MGLGYFKQGEVDEKQKTEILKKLVDIVGEDRVSDDDAVLFPYSYDVGNLSTPKHPAGKPDYVILPVTVEEVQSIVLLANEYKIPLIPFISGANMGGCAVPEQGGILVDLHKMNKIVEINEKANYVVVEPGVTIGMLEKTLAKLNRWVSTPLAPPAAASIVGNVLLSGIGHVSAHYGNQGELLNAAEVVLPTGEVVKVGSAGLTNSWHSRYPMPDLTGLFVNWQGTTGIVTKMGIPMYERPPYKDVITFGFDTYEEAIDEFMIPWSRKELAHDITGLNWPLANISVKKHPLGERPADQPLVFVLSVVAGYTTEEIEFKKKALYAFVEDIKQSGKVPSIKEIEMPEKTKDYRAVNIPNPYAFLYADHRNGGAVYWCGSFMPADQWVPAYKQADAIMSDLGFAAATRVSMFRGSHYGMFRSIVPYNKDDDQEVEKVRKVAEGLVKNVIEHDGVAYKQPTWASKLTLESEKADPNYNQMMQKIKKTLDPNGIMNPGKWNL